MGNYLSSKEGEVAILDATNTTRARRRMVAEFCANRRTLIDPPFRVFFVESICDDPDVINSNITEVKINSPDYKGIMTQEEAKEDFLKRIENYKLQYEPLDEEEDEDLSFIKHGESEYNQLGRLGGDSPLSENGLKYAEKLREYFEIKPMLMQ
ncbi:6-phosphofructo-2-kinase [Ancylostoma ceylanicum]|uniref:6-phosphofructo-2-kinase n=1 Tax=Ancylostoma ceylanicum TaxID=53326 RepID=A0A0D6LX94_9BILA|nr:6-phosphofructo-2-kinase [Ancylostoma ceylanicum]